MHPLSTIKTLRARAVDVPIAPLKTASGAITSCPLVLIDIETSEGMIGRSYLFAYTRVCLQPLTTLIQNLASALIAQSASPSETADRLGKTFRLVGTGGLMAMALGGIDMALWDAWAKAGGVSLVTLLGGVRRKLPAYWSVGMCAPDEARRAAEAALAHGCRALKIKIGFSALTDDLAAIRAVRDVGGADLQLMVDYNQSLAVPEAKRRIRYLEDNELTWVEEPTLAEDFAGHAAIAREANLPIQLGENWSSLLEMARSITEVASDFAMLDAMKIGGVTGWLRAAALAQVHGLSVSSHIFPEISAHLLAVTPTAHWLEFLDLASAVLQQPASVRDGGVIANESPGSGIEWNEPAIEKYGLRPN